MSQIDEKSAQSKRSHTSGKSEKIKLLVDTTTTLENEVKNLNISIKDLIEINNNLENKNKNMFIKQLELENQVNNINKNIEHECDKIINFKMICFLCSLTLVIIIYGLNFLNNPTKNISTEDVLGAISAIGFIYVAIEKIIPQK